jgi:hypothetical protein
MDGPDGHYDIWNNGRWSTIDGSNGFHADGYHWAMATLIEPSQILAGAMDRGNKRGILR